MAMMKLHTPMLVKLSCNYIISVILCISSRVTHAVHGVYSFSYQPHSCACEIKFLYNMPTKNLMNVLVLSYHLCAATLCLQQDEVCMQMKHLWLTINVAITKGLNQHRFSHEVMIYLPHDRDLRPSVVAVVISDFCVERLVLYLTEHLNQSWHLLYI